MKSMTNTDNNNHDFDADALLAELISDRQRLERIIAAVGEIATVRAAYKTAALKHYTENGVDIDDAIFMANQDANTYWDQQE